MAWEREAIRFFRTRARVLSSFIQPVLFLFVLGYGMSTLVGTTAAGFDFKKFLFPGIVAMAVMSTALSSAISIVWDREFGFLREMLVARSAAPRWCPARPLAGPASPPSRAPSCSPWRRSSAFA
ncbi:MAG TPA: ABC transporter permease [Streptosporangiaceae bacterium]